MKIDLTSKTALVTGSTQGIGFAIAKGLAAAGASVVINGRNQKKIDAALAELGGSAKGIAADVSTAEGCAALVKALPTCDILVNNAGIFKPADFFQTTDADWDSHWHANVMSGVRLARAYLPAMERVGWGRCVFISSESGFNIPVEMIHYGVTKTADIAIARGLAKRMAGTGVTVNSVLPGPTMSDGVNVMVSKAAKASGRSVEQEFDNFIAEHRPSSILRRAIKVEEVANLVVYVVSEQASATTGAALRVDGGVVDSL
jgi:NAD(P)-dependent dehydrogenase (short-subunit alcohol dehydrogenase family)